MAPLNKTNYSNSCEYGMFGIHLPWCVQKIIYLSSVVF